MRPQTRTGGPTVIGAVATVAAAGLVLGLTPNHAEATTEVRSEDIVNSTDGQTVLPDPDATVSDLDDPRAGIVVGPAPRGANESPSVSAQSVPDAKDPDKKKPAKKDKPVVKRVRPWLSPNTSRKFGVAQVVTMRFSVDVERKRLVERSIKITGRQNRGKKKLVKLPAGAWGWTDSRTAVYRPKKFWPGRTTIRFKVDLRGVPVARHGDVRYQGGSRSKFNYELRTGRSLILKIRDKTHRMHVIRDGKQVRSFGVSLGRSRYETRSGIKVLTDIKYRVLRMRGTDRYTGEKWDVMSPYSMPLATNGEFIHGAPWARFRIGIRNGSHGCTNMNSEDARWLYNRVGAGDPVVTRGTGKKMQLWMAFTPTEPWIYTWRQWKAL